jgi:hypothetical protein
MVWTASTKFGLHAGNMILIAQIEDWMTVVCLILCAFLYTSRAIRIYCY